jgi:hypothetical protein
VICIDVGLYDADCLLIGGDFTADLMRGVGDGITTPDFMYIATFVDRCMDEPDNPPLGQAFYYQTVIRNALGEEVIACGT